MIIKNKKVFQSLILFTMLISIIGVNFSGIIVSGRSQEELDFQNSINSETIQLPGNLVKENTNIMNIFDRTERINEIIKNPTNILTVIAENDTSVKNYSMNSVEYGWFDAEGNGYNLMVNGDDTYGTVSLPFAFSFYDTTFDSIYISSNGWLSFSNPSPLEYINPSFPNYEDRYIYALAPFWDDLIAQDNIYVWTTPEFVVVEYSNYEYLGGQYIGNFEVILFASGEIVFQYESIDNDVGATVGLNYGFNSSIYNAYTEGLSNVSNFALLFQKMNYDHDISVQISKLENPIIEVPVNVNATLTNLGMNNESNIDFTFYLDYGLIGSELIPNLLVGENFTITYEWTPPSYGIYNFTALVSPVTNETYLGNNDFTQIVSILHDLDVSLSIPSYALINSTYVVNATVINLGANPEANITFDFNLDGVLIASDFIPTLLGGENFTLSYVWTPDTFDSYNFTANATLEIIDPYIGIYEDTQTIIVANNQIYPNLGDIFQLSERDILNNSPYFISFEVTAFPSPDQCNISLSFWDPGTQQETVDQTFIVNPFTREIYNSTQWDPELFPYWINTEGLTNGSFIDFMYIGDQEGQVVGFTTFDYYGQSLPLIEIFVQNMNLYFEQNSGILAAIGYEDEFEYSEGFDLVFTNIASAVEDFHNLRGAICPPYELDNHPLEIVQIFVQNTGTYAESTSASLSYNGNLVGTEIVSLLPGEFVFFSYEVDEFAEEFGGLDLVVEPVGEETYLVDNYESIPRIYTAELTFHVYKEDSDIRIEDAWVFIYDESDIEIYVGQTNANGSLVVSELSAQTYEIVVNATDYELYSETISIGEGEHKNVDIYLTHLSINIFIPGYSFMC